MRILQIAILGAAAAGIAFGGTACSTPPSQPWCANTIATGGLDCGYRSYEQCKATVSGVGGSCVQNPRGPGQSSGRSRAG